MKKDILKDYEEKRHKLVLERIKNAKSVKELPNITFSSIAKYLCDNVHFDYNYLSPKEFKTFIIKYMTFDIDSKECFIDILARNYPNHTKDEFEAMYTKIISSGRIGNMFVELGERNNKMYELNDELEKEKHEKIMFEIKNTIALNEFPHITKSYLVSLVKKASKNDITVLNDEQIRGLVSLIYEKSDLSVISKEVLSICQSYHLTYEENYIMYNQIIVSLVANKKIGYVVDELKEIEKQKCKIYKNDHLIILEKIHAALNADELPNINANKLATYLSCNSKIYKNSKKIKVSEFNKLVDILLSGKGINNKLSKEEINNIILNQNYENPEEAYELLLDKFSSLYRINFFIEEINLKNKRMEEFLGDDYLDINIYAFQTPNGPVNGGVHYTLFKNSVDNLDINAIVPEWNDLDELEDKVKLVDPTFKKIGGFIIKKNESFRQKNNIKFYKKRDDEETISTLENSRLAKIEKLSVKLNELLELQEKEQAEYERKRKINDEKMMQIRDELFELTNDDEEIVVKKKGV